jgi:hypothetical protein
MKKPPRPERRGPFSTTLFRYKGKAAWFFATIPKSMAPKPTHPWGRTPVTATVDGVTWRTSLWRDAKSSGSLLAVPRKLRGTKGDGDRVTVTLEFELDDD